MVETAVGGVGFFGVGCEVRATGGKVGMPVADGVADGGSVLVATLVLVAEGGVKGGVKGGVEGGVEGACVGVYSKSTAEVGIGSKGNGLEGNRARMSAMIKIGSTGIAAHNATRRPLRRRFTPGLYRRPGIGTLPV